MKLSFVKINQRFLGEAVALTASIVLICMMPIDSASAEIPAVTKSRELLLKNDRAGALQALMQTLAGSTSSNAKALTVRNSSTPKAASLSRAQRQEILSAIREAREIFLTERGQAQYSLATSLWLQKPRDAIQALESAQAAEKGNSLVAQLTARALLRLRDCARAKREVQALAAIERVEPSALSAEVQLLQLQQQFCAWEQEAASQPFRPPQSPELIPFEIFIKRLVFRDAIRRRDLKAAQAAISAWEAIDPQDPELWWAKWRASRTVDQKAGEANQEMAGASDAVKSDANAGRKYISTCTDLSPRRRAKYELDPEFCGQVERVEIELKDIEQKP